MMQRRFFGLALCGGVALAQQQTITIERKIATAGGKEPTVFFLSTRSDTLKGAPYSADRTTETIQVLADGNRITHSNKSSFARDGEGRTRLDTQIQHFGPVGAAEEAATSTFINDPVAKASYTLDAKNKIAYKSVWGDMSAVSAEAGPMRWKTRVDAPGAGAKEDVVIERRATVTTIDVPGSPAHAGAAGAIAGLSVASVPAMPMGNVRIADYSGSGAPPEDLGERNFDGVIAKGTKHVMKIAAGAIGNERELQVITETWFSDQLKEPVYTRHSDPRFGETITKLSNIKLGEPPASLFDVPADYKIESISNMRMPKPAIVRE